LLWEWRNSDREVLRFTKPFLNKIVAEWKSPRSSGFERSLYSSTGTSLNLEATQFSRLDSDAAPVHKKLLAGATLDDGDRIIWAKFVKSMMFRQPENVREFREKAPGRLMQVLLAKHAGNSEVLQSPETSLHHEFGTDKTVAVKVLEDLNKNVSGPVNHLLLDSYWLCVRSSPNCNDFLLSDSPVIFCNKQVMNGGYVFLPISPRILFVADIKNSTFPIGQAALNPSIVRAINKEIVSTASFCVVSSNEAQRPFIDKYFGTKNRKGRMSN
jgi:hypothetical protein